MDVSYDKMSAIANDLIVDVFENVLVNAINYNINSHKEIIIKAFLLEDNSQSHIIIEFIDNGTGFEDSRKDVIFHRGYKAEKGSKGMGLGLSLVKKFLIFYNGKIWIENKVDEDYSKGSKFLILLQNAQT